MFLKRFLPKVSISGLWFSCVNEMRLLFFLVSLHLQIKKKETQQIFRECFGKSPDSQFSLSLNFPQQCLNNKNKHNVTLIMLSIVRKVNFKDRDQRKDHHILGNLRNPRSRCESISEQYRGSCPWQFPAIPLWNGHPILIRQTGMMGEHSKC